MLQEHIYSCLLIIVLFFVSHSHFHKSYTSDFLRGPRHPRILADYPQESEEFRTQLSEGIYAFLQPNSVYSQYLTPNKGAYLDNFRSVLNDAIVSLINQIVFALEYQIVRQLLPFLKLLFRLYSNSFTILGYHNEMSLMKKQLYGVPLIF